MSTISQTEVFRSKSDTSFGACLMSYVLCLLLMNVLTIVTTKFFEIFLNSKNCEPMNPILKFYNYLETTLTEHLCERLHKNKHKNIYIINKVSKQN